jgi:hypothetical protein
MSNFLTLSWAKSWKNQGLLWHYDCSIKRMKTLILIMSILSSGAFAQNYTKKELIQMSLERLFPNGANKKARVDMRDIILEWNKVFDEQNLNRDKNKTRTNWAKLLPIKNKKIHHIEGKRVFYNVFKKNYRYDIIEDPELNRLIVHVKMHFYPSKTYLKRMEKLHATNDKDKIYYPKLDELKKQVAANVLESEAVWNAQAPKGVGFEFEVVEDPSDAHYSLKLVTHFGALYDKFIMAPAPSSFLSHEAGHMMGLDDEYSFITTNILPVNSLTEKMSIYHRNRDMDYTSYQDMRCNLESIMCLREKIYPYHLDHILGRIKDR